MDDLEKVFLVFMRMPGTVIQTVTDREGFPIGQVVEVDEGDHKFTDVFRMDEVEDFDPELWGE